MFTCNPTKIAQKTDIISDMQLYSTGYGNLPSSRRLSEALVVMDGDVVASPTRARPELGHVTKLLSMQPLPPDPATQQHNIPQPTTHPHEEPSSPSRKRLRCVNPSANTEPIPLPVFNLGDCESGTPAARLLRDLVNTVNSYAHLEPNALDNNVWYEVCECIALSISDSISYMEYGDDAEDTRAIRKAMKHFSSLANPYTKDEDTDMDQDQDLEPVQLLPPPAFPNPANNAILSILRDIQSNNKHINDRMIRLENRINNAAKHQEDRCSKPNGSSNAPSAMSTTASPAAAEEPNTASYAKVTATNTRTGDNGQGTMTSANPGPKPDANVPQQWMQPIRYVVHYLGNPPSQDQRLLPKIICNRINNKLRLIPSAKGLSVLGSHWNASGNCILTFPPQTSTKLIEDHYPAIRNAMGLGDDWVISRDIPWSKVTLRAVYARDTPSSNVYTNEELMASLMANPIMNKIKVTQPPRWVRRPEDIDGFKSSVSFAFEDPDGQAIKLLLKTQLFMFGSPVRAKRWEDKPCLRQCTRCWKLGHFEVTCRALARCRRCSEKHLEAAHREHCKECTNSKATIPCNHPPKCANCCESHVADAPECPERCKYSIPLAARSHPAEHSDNDRMQG
jgi:hypothetical protein